MTLRALIVRRWTRNHHSVAGKFQLAVDDAPLLVGHSSAFDETKGPHQPIHGCGRIFIRHHGKYSLFWHRLTVRGRFFRPATPARAAGSQLLPAMTPPQPKGFPAGSAAAFSPAPRKRP